MRAVVTGASGFLGTELLRQLIESDKCEICAATSRPEELRARIGTSKVVVSDAGSLLNTGFFGPGDIVINCAFPRGSNGFDLARGLDYLSCLLLRASQSGVTGFINISSQSVYDQHRDQPAKEDAALCLQSIYAVAKRAVELQTEAVLSDIPFSNIRLASLIGPGFDQRVPNRMIESAVRSGRIQVSENGSRFGFMDVRDAANALPRMLEHPPCDWKHYYNLSSEHIWTLTETARTIQEMLESDFGLGVKIDEKPPKADPVNTLVDSTLFSTEFDWYPLYDMRDSIRAIIDSVR